MTFYVALQINQKICTITKKRNYNFIAIINHQPMKLIKPFIFHLIETFYAVIIQNHKKCTIKIPNELLQKLNYHKILYDMTFFILNSKLKKLMLSLAGIKRDSFGAWIEGNISWPPLIYYTWSDTQKKYYI